jgi:hypothetical protein
MKHLKRKYVKSTKIGDEVANYLENTSIAEDVVEKIVQQNFDGYYAIVKTNGNELIQTFKFPQDEKFFFIPEPDPIVIYFDTGRNFYKNISSLKDALLKTLNEQPANAHIITTKFYSFFANASAFIIFIFLSIEALVNKIIPVGFEYRRIQDKKTEVFDKSQIQRNIDILEKIKHVLPQAIGKAFHVEHGHNSTLLGR